MQYIMYRTNQILCDTMCITMSTLAERLKKSRENAGYETAADFARDHTLSEATYRSHDRTVDEVNVIGRVVWFARRV